MKNLNEKHYFLLCGWLVLNLIQAAFTNLHSDEAYYWMYSQHLDWGYFDHPPLTALLIKAGDIIFHNELGVRLFFVLISTVTMAMIMNELNEKDDILFLGLFMVSFPLVHTHIGGFMALPDIPLVFFSVLLIITYKKFISNPGYKNAIYLAIIAALMIYSKYHALAFLGLIILSNLKLFRNRYFWFAVILAFIMLLPHINWQFENHFQTFQYHLNDRFKPIQFSTVLNNISSQFVVAGPLTAIFIFYCLSKFKTGKDDFKRALIFTSLGFYLLFFVLSFKNRIEAHWTTVITPLLMIITFPIIVKNKNLKKWFFWLAVPTLAFFLMLRFYLAADFLPKIGVLKAAFYNHKASTEQIKEMAAGKQVASFNNFAFPGVYQFYTGEPVVHLATPGYRYCQYDFWHEEDIAAGDSLFVIIPDRMDNTELVELKNCKKVKLIIIPEFQSLREMSLTKNDFWIAKDSLRFKITITNQSKHSLKFKHSSIPSIGYMQNKKEISSIPLFQVTGKEKINSKESFCFNYNIPIEMIDRSKPITIFTQTIDRNRGQMFTLDLEE